MFSLMTEKNIIKLCSRMTFRARIHRHIFLKENEPRNIFGTVTEKRTPAYSSRGLAKSIGLAPLGLAKAIYYGSK